MNEARVWEGVMWASDDGSRQLCMNNVIVLPATLKCSLMPALCPSDDCNELVRNRFT